MQLDIKLDHSDSKTAVFTMTIVNDDGNAAAGTYSVDRDKKITVTIPEENRVGITSNNEQEQQ